VEKKKVIVGDTDTNAAITGALLGSFYGITQLLFDHVTNKNIKYIIIM